MYYKMTLDQIRAELEYRKEFAGKASAALGGVTIEKTKSGKEFENLSRGLKGARKIQEFGFDRLSVVFSTSRKMYENYTVDIYGYIDELPTDDPRRANYIKSFMRQKYILTAEEIREKIRREIEILTDRENDYTRQIAVAQEAAKKYRAAIESAEEELQKVCDRPGQIGHSSAYYLITETR